MSVAQQDFSAIKGRLMAKRTALEQRHRRVRDALQRRTDPLVGDADDRAIQLQNDEALSVIEAATRNELATLNVALERCDRGLYGICKECGDDIEPARLQLLHAVTCAKCATG